MPNQIFDLNPITHITAGAVGEPGQRTFYIQARQDNRLVTLLCEKQQVAALAMGVEQLLDQLADKDPEHVGRSDQILEIDMELEEPLEPDFRVGQMGLGYDEERGLVVMVAQELLPEDIDPATASSARAEQKGFLDVAQKPLYEIIPDYVLPGVSNQALATILAGILGMLIVFGVALAVAYVRRNRLISNR